MMKINKNDSQKQDAAICSVFLRLDADLLFDHRRDEFQRPSNGKLFTL